MITRAGTFGNESYAQVGSGDDTTERRFSALPAEFLSEGDLRHQSGYPDERISFRGARRRRSVSSCCPAEFRRVHSWLVRDRQKTSGMRIQQEVS